MGWGRAALAAPAMRRLHPAGAVGLVEVQQQVQGSAGEKLGSRVVALGVLEGFVSAQERKIKIWSYGSAVSLVWGCKGFGAVPGRRPCQGLPFQLSCPVPRFALEKRCRWFLERDPSNPPSENNKPKPVIAFGLEQFELGVNWLRTA